MQAKNIHYNRKIAFWHFASCQPRRNQSISRCNQNAIITRSIARRCCIASNFARRCSYPDKKDRLTARLNFARGKNASQNKNARGCNAAFFARPCSIDHAAMQKIDGQKMKKPCKISILAPTVEKAHPTVEKAHPTVEKAQG